MPVENDRRIKSLNKAINACLNNAERLLCDAELLGVEYNEDSAPTCYALSILAQEEYAKAFILYLINNDCVPWNADVRKLLKNHSCKQLVTLILDFLNPEDEIFNKRVEDFFKGVCSDRLPFLPHSIEDAIHIIKYEKAEKWGTRNDWIDSEERPCDTISRKISDGVLDKSKQDALYVRIGKTGQVVSTPKKIKIGLAKQEYEKAKRFAWVVSCRDGKLTGPAGLDFEKVSDTFRVLFRLISFEDFNKRWLW